MKGFFSIAALLIVAMVLRLGMPAENKVCLRDDLGSGKRALYKTFVGTGLIRVANVQDFFLFKVGTLGDQKVVLIPFTNGWSAL
jgi:hypothetical protein